MIQPSYCVSVARATVTCHTAQGPRAAMTACRAIVILVYGRDARGSLGGSPCAGGLLTFSSRELTRTGPPARFLQAPLGQEGYILYMYFVNTYNIEYITWF